MAMFFDDLSITPINISASRGIPIIITGSVDGALTDYQISFLLPYNRHIDFDYGNVYFVDSDGNTELSFWAEFIFNKELARYWVKVPSIPANPDSKIIYARYDGGGVNVSNDSGTFLVGADFDDDATTGLTINLAGSASANTVAGTAMVGVKTGRAGKLMNNPVLTLGAGGAWDDAQVRDFAIMVDEDGYNVVNSDGLWGYYSGYDGSVWKIGLAKSTDGGFTWTKYGSNPVASGAGSGWYQTGVLQPAVVKQTNGTYIMVAAGKDVSDVDSIGILTSVDGLSWSDSGQKLTMAQFTDGGTALTQMGVPRILKNVDGTWRMLLEGLKTGVANGWKIYGATASVPTGTWAVMNSGSPIFSNGSGWESVGVANPTMMETTAGSYLMAYNGIDGGGNWKVGLASTTDFSTWTRSSDNPILSPMYTPPGWEPFHNEASFMCRDIGSTHIRIYYNGYKDSGATPQIGLAMMPQGKMLNPKDTASTADGWIVGVDMDAYSTFYFECLIHETADTSNASNAQYGLMDFASVPSPTTNTTWNAAARFTISRQSPSDTDANKLYILYTDTGGAAHFWNGSTWVGSPYLFGCGGLVKLRIWDDGTNYKANLIDFNNNGFSGSIATIAKTSVKAFSAGRTLVAAEPFTNFYYNGTELDNFILRQYTANPPIISVGNPT